MWEYVGNNIFSILLPLARIFTVTEGNKHACYFVCGLLHISVNLY